MSAWACICLHAVCVHWESGTAVGRFRLINDNHNDDDTNGDVQETGQTTMIGWHQPLGNECQLHNGTLRMSRYRSSVTMFKSLTSWMACKNHQISMRRINISNHMPNIYCYWCVTYKWGTLLDIGELLMAKDWIGPWISRQVRIGCSSHVTWGLLGIIAASAVLKTNTQH